MLNLFDSSFKTDNTILPKITKRRQSVLSVAKQYTGNKNISNLITDIKNKVLYHLKKYEKDCIIIKDKNELLEYIEQANKVGYIAIDTETTGLDVIDCDIVGISIYTKDSKAAYIPINHKSLNTYSRYKEQMEISDITEILNKLTAKIIMHNAKFDLHILRNKLNYNPKIYWDTFILEKLLVNGTYISAGLKASYSRIKNLNEPVLDFDGYFKGITFDLIPIDYGYIYAAMDAKFTYELYEYQVKNYKDNEDYERLYYLFRNVEMRVLRVILDMEDRGVLFNNSLIEDLKKEYTEKLFIVEKELNSLLKEYEREIYNYRKVNINNCKLSNPINFSSPQQIAILLYDVVGISETDNKRATGEEILKEINLPITNKLLEYRELKKVLTTYIEKMPKVVKSDNRIHTSFNPMGTVTGRFSSENPNLQNIPTSGNIRSLFRADEGYYLLSCDYSSQEPRIASHISKDNTMITAFKESKDFYAFLASNAYHIPYENCLESYKEYDKKGNIIFDGKFVRKKAKNNFLGICYGMGYLSLASGLGITIEEAIESKKAILKACPGLEKLTKAAVNFGREYGYIETYYGRRRILNNINKDKFEVEFINTSAIPFNPLSFDGIGNEERNLKNKIISELNATKSFKSLNWVKSKYEREGVRIKDNTGLISEDERYCINTLIQGTAADMMKKALIEVYNDNRLKDCKFELLLTIHDEILGQCPKEYIKEAAAYLSEDMLKPTLEYVVPFKCDCIAFETWDGKEVAI